MSVTPTGKLKIQIDPTPNKMQSLAFGTWKTGLHLLESGNFKRAELQLRKAYKIFNNLGEFYRAIGIMHQQGVVYRELANKPQNEENVKIIREISYKMLCIAAKGLLAEINQESTRKTLFSSSFFTQIIFDLNILHIEMDHYKTSDELLVIPMLYFNELPLIYKLKLLYHQGVTKIILKEPLEAIGKFYPLIKELEKEHYNFTKSEEMHELQKNARSYFTQALEMVLQGNNNNQKKTRTDARLAIKLGLFTTPNF